MMQNTHEQLDQLFENYLKTEKNMDFFAYNTAVHIAAMLIVELKGSDAALRFLADRRERTNETKRRQDA